MAGVIGTWVDGCKAVGSKRPMRTFPPGSGPIRPTILNFKPNGIAAVSKLALGEPDVIALWFGETDLVTPAFIRDAAKQALDDGRTFYANARGIPTLRQALRAFHLRA